jgi:hypothetical protein
MGSFISAWDAVSNAIKGSAEKIGIPVANIKNAGPGAALSSKSISVWCEVEASEKSEGGARSRMLAAYVAVSGEVAAVEAVRYASAMTYGRRVERTLAGLRIAGNTPVLISEPENIDAGSASFWLIGIKAAWRFPGDEPWEDES